MENKEMILVTDWEKVDSDDFYLTPEWARLQDFDEQVKSAKKLSKQDKLYVGYIVPAVNYAIYREMDAQQVFINEDMDIVLECESAVIGNNHEKRIEYNY